MTHAHFKRRSNAVPTVCWRGADSRSAGETVLLDTTALVISSVLFGPPVWENCGVLAQLSGMTILKETPPLPSEVTWPIKPYRLSRFM